MKRYRGYIYPLRPRISLCSCGLHSRRIGRPHAFGNLAAVLPLDHRDVVLALQVEPELRAVAEVAPEPDRRIGGDRAPCIENVGDAAGRNADVERQPVGAEPACRELALQEPSGM